MTQSTQLNDRSKRRLLKDFRALQRDPSPGVNAAPNGNDLSTWTAIVFGPEGTTWEGGAFELSMKFPETYPDKPPIVKFITKIFHPNVYADGMLCLDILQNEWSPIYDINGILMSIRSLLTDPNTDSPANVEAARLYTQNRREYQRCVGRCVNDSLANLMAE